MAILLNVNTHSGEWLKAFTFDQNQRSRSVRITVHVRPERVFTLLQNMHPKPKFSELKYQTGFGRSDFRVESRQAPGHEAGQFRRQLSAEPRKLMLAGGGVDRRKRTGDYVQPTTAPTGGKRSLPTQSR